MKVKIRWSETVTYQSTVEVDEAEVRAWLNEAGPGEPPLNAKAPDEALTASEVLDYLQAGDDVWFDQCSTQKDIYAVEDRNLDAVEDLIP